MNNLKQGQKVFDYISQEWLTISEIFEGHKYSVEIDNSKEYTSDGKYLISDTLPRLSLTEWNPIEGTGSYTPIDQEPPIQEGDRVFAWDKEGGG